MNKIAFEWDDVKNSKNKVRHGVSFEEAQTVFFDENAIEFDDPDHSIDEERFLLLGIAINSGCSLFATAIAVQNQQSASFQPGKEL